MNNKYFYLMFCVIICAFSLFFTARRAMASTITAVSCNQTDVQNAINQANDGDTVQVPAGTCTWTQPVNIGSYSYSTKKSTNKSITLQGAGIGQTTIIDTAPLANALSMSIQDGKLVRVTGFTFDGSATADNYSIIGISGDVSNTPAFRIDHCLFDNIIERGINIYYVYGLIDHNTFIRKPDGPNPTLVSISGDTFERTGDHNDSWARPQDMGTDHAVYIEDNTFIHNINANGPLDAYEGARYVFRHNQVYGNNLGHHGYDSSIRGIVNFEIYDNTFTNASPTDEPYVHGIVFEFRSGSGVVFNNTITRSAHATNYLGFYDAFALLRNYRSDPTYLNSMGGGPCNGTNPNDGNQDSSGYPCKDQIGRSTNQILSPVYAWNNDFQGTVGGNLIIGEHGNNTITSTYHIIANRDYYNGIPKPGYVPYTYPHPLTLSGFVPSPTPPPTPTPVPTPTPAPTPTPTPTPGNNQLPKGVFDGVDTTTGMVQGWSYDPDQAATPNPVHIYIDGAAGAGTLVSSTATDALRADVNAAFSISGNHGIAFAIPSAYRNGISHTVYVYGIDLNDSTKSTLLPGSPKTFTLGAINPNPTPTPIPELPTSTPTPTPSASSPYPDAKLINDHGTIYIIEYGQKRPFVSMPVFTNLGYKLKNVISADTSSITQGGGVFTPLDRHVHGSVVLSGSTVYFIGTDYRYPFPSSDVFFSWGHTFSELVRANAADLAMPVGPVVQVKP